MKYVNTGAGAGTVALVVLGILAGTGAAQAGAQYLDKTKFAVSGYDVVAYRALKQVTPGKMQPGAVAGKKEFTAEWNGAKWAFANAANRDKFLKMPGSFAPQYDGHCAYGVAQGAKVPANPNLWRVVDGKLYLNITPDVAMTWEKNISGYLTKSEKRWGSLEPKAASRNQVPYFNTKKAPL